MQVEFYFRVTMSPHDGYHCETFAIGDPRNQDWVDESTLYVDWYSELDVDYTKSWTATGKARFEGSYDHNNEYDEELTVIEHRAVEVVCA